MENPLCPTIFVFGSNLAGRHGRGSALHARTKFGAEYGVGEGRTGMAYAIPTKDKNLKVRSLNEIDDSVSKFLTYARCNPDLHFFVVEIGCGLAGYTPEQIAPFFFGCPDNVRLPLNFWKVLHTGTN